MDKQERTALFQSKKIKRLVVLKNKGRKKERKKEFLIVKKNVKETYRKCFKKAP